MVSVLPSLLVLGLIGWGLARLLGFGGTPNARPDEGDARELAARLVRYILLAVAAVMVIEGVAQLVGSLLQQLSDPVVAVDPERVATALSFTVVGVPALVGLIWWIRRRRDTDPADRPIELWSIVWAGYLGLAVTTAAIVVAFNTLEVLAWLLGESDFDPDALARTIVWGVALTVHWVLNGRRPLVDSDGHPQDRTPLYLIVGSALSLFAFTFGAWQALRTVLRLLYDSSAAEVMAGTVWGWRLPLVHLVVGAVAWAWYWLVHARRGPSDARWYTYVLLIGVLLGLTMALSAAGTLLYSVLEWFLGDPRSESAIDHFDLVPGTVSTLAVGLGLWFHHRSVLAPAAASRAAADRTGTDRVAADRVHGDRAEVDRADADRVYDYLLAFVGLTVVAGSVAALVTVLIETLVSGLTVAERAVVNDVLVAVTLLVVGGPLWWWAWRRAEAWALDGLAEVRSVPRRVYLIAVLGSTALAVLIATVSLLSAFFEDLTQGELSSETVLAIRLPFGVLVAGGAVLAYHLLAYRDDQEILEAAAEADQPPPPMAADSTDPADTSQPVPTVLVSDLDDAGVAALATTLGLTVETHHRLAGDPGPEPDQATLAEVILPRPGLVLVMVTDGRVTVSELAPG